MRFISCFHGDRKVGQCSTCFGHYLFLLCLTLCNPVDCSMPGLPVHHQLPEFTQTHVHWVSDAIQPSHPLSSPLFLPSIFSSIRVCSYELALCIKWPKYWSFSFSVSPSNEYSGLISFKIDWFDHLAVEGTLKSPLQYHSSRAFSSLGLRLLNGPIVTFIQDDWKNKSFGYRDLHWHANVSAF